MESVFAVFDGERFITEKKIDFKKGQKIIMTILEDEISVEDEANSMHITAVKSGAFNYLFEEGEQEYDIEDCKTKFK
jgi:hypothetical protein